MVAFPTAGFLFPAWIFKLGFLADFLSCTVLVGFLTGVGFQVATAMLSDMFGVSVSSHSRLAQAWENLQDLPKFNVPTWHCPRSLQAAYCSAYVSPRAFLFHYLR
jgi:sulfate permease, SulP family